MKKSIDILAEDGILTKEAVARLKNAWIRDVDELYSRAKACGFSGDKRMAEAMEQELGIERGTLAGFQKYIETYVSPELIKAEAPKEYPLGARLR